MFGGYVEFAWRNLRRNPWLAVLVVATVAVGIGASMTAYSLLRAMSQNPVPQKAGRLFAASLDANGLASVRGGPSPPFMPYRDAMELWRARLARHQAVMFPAHYMVRTNATEKVEAMTRGLATQAEMFPMFGLTFLRGGAWSAADDAGKARVVVVSQSLARRLFPGVADVTHHVVLLNGQSFEIVGVVRDWQPQPHFHAPFDRVSGARGFLAADELFIPIETAVVTNGPANPGTGPSECNRAIGQVQHAGTRAALLGGNCSWVYLWVELDGRSQVARYEELLRNHALEQHRSGRFPWEPLWRLYGLDDWLVTFRIVRSEYRLSAAVGFAFLAVCLVNAIGLMLARFHARGTELHLQRALGASRRVLFRQCLLETGAMGLAGGALGLGLLFAGIGIQRSILPPGVAQVAGADAFVMAGTVLLAVTGTVCAGLYPAWTASRVGSIGGARQHGQNRFGTALLAVLLALTLGIVSNALHVAWVQIQAARQPSGIDEDSILQISARWPGTPADRRARIDADLAALRNMAGVHDASAISALPLTSDLVGAPVYADVPTDSVRNAGEVAANLIFVDSHGLESLGLTRTCGRWFTPEDSGQRVAVLTDNLAKRLFPAGDACENKTVYVTRDSSWLVIGTVAGFGSRVGGADNAMLQPNPWFLDDEVHYVVRARPGQFEAVFSRVAPILLDLDPTRVVSGPRPFEDIRGAAFRFNHNLATTLFGVCTLLLLVISLGIFGLTHYWISQRRLLIGIRRALGARRIHILLRFQGENLGIVALGTGFGAVLAVAGSRWLTTQFPVPPLDPAALAAGAGIVLLGSQLAVLWPALRASLIPPAVVTRAT